MNNIHILEGDQANVDAIVNAANPQMLGGGGVDGAIHRAAGPSLREACLQVEAINGIRCPFGDARITAAGNLPCQFVVHTVGPIYGRFEDPRAVLESAYRRSLTLAMENGCKSVAFPAISCGAYGYPHEEAADVAISVCSEPAFQNLDIYFYLYGDRMVSIWQDAYNNLKEKDSYGSA